MKQGIELIKELALAFGPPSCEGEVTALIERELQDCGAELTKDRMGNLLARLPGPQGSPRVLLSAHTDEVGFMITEIDDEGFLRFENVGGIHEGVLMGRQVLLGDEQRRVPGVIAAKGIHVQTAEERKKLPKSSELYIDIGTKDRAESEALLSRGDFGVFDVPFTRLGEQGEYMACKALDDRLGCAVLIELLRAVKDKHLPLDLYFAFTVREEIGRSGALVTANRLAPDVAFIIETTAIADHPLVPEHKRVASVGAGGVISLLDRSTIYDRTLVDLALDCAKVQQIPVQIKKYVSGGNDAACIQKSRAGVRCMALSAPTRYLHAPVSVAAVRDFEAMVALLAAVLEKLKGALEYV